MNTKIMNEKLFQNEDFYRRLAHLFYACASADKNIVIEEKRRIVREVECYWDFHTETFDGKTILFDTMREIICGELDNQLVFKSFSDFYTENKSDFTDDIKLKIQNSANAIIRSYAGANKSELTLLTQLHLLLKNN